MVRLKANKLTVCFASIIFQFLVVRLKVTVIKYPVNFIGFQFLVVRLKESCCYRRFCKTVFQFLVVRLKDIRTKKPVLYLYLFQFLVVRLKDHHPLNLGDVFIISIPCGSIKSFTVTVINQYDTHFNSLWFD